MNKSLKHHAKWENSSIKDHIVYDFINVKCPAKTNSRLIVDKYCGRLEWTVIANGDLCLAEKNILGLYSSDDSTTLWIY